MRLIPRPRVLAANSEHVLLLKGLLLAMAVAVAFLAAWHYGLIQRVWNEDPTGMSTAITVIFLLAAAHGAHSFARLSRALNEIGQIEDRLVSEVAIAIGDMHIIAPPGCIGAYLEKLYRKAKFGGPRPIDQTLLLDSFESELRHGHTFGWFVADLLLSLGLLGTVVGFILMLGPISGLESSDHGAVREALSAMSDGMAVALYTTLTGLLGGLLLKVQGMFLDAAVADLLRRMTEVTEVYVLPEIERVKAHAAA